mmetsp:Transcript_4539/g.14208  ORF Transcript_4539/g.14208 Transcript_4539/m.14208 type:complete len:257 (-) Transcript_4539:558-1328(-)
MGPEPLAPSRLPARAERGRRGLQRRSVGRAERRRGLLDEVRKVVFVAEVEAHGEAKVEELEGAVGGDAEVLRLEVAVQDAVAGDRAAGMQVQQSRGDFVDELQPPQRGPLLHDFSAHLLARGGSSSGRRRRQVVQAEGAPHGPRDPLQHGAGRPAHGVRRDADELADVLVLNQREHVDFALEGAHFLLEVGEGGFQRLESVDLRPAGFAVDVVDAIHERLAPARARQQRDLVLHVVVLERVLRRLLAVRDRRRQRS